MDKKEINEIFGKIKKAQALMHSIKEPTKITVDRFKREAKYLWGFLNNFTKSLKGRYIPSKTWRTIPPTIDGTDDFEKIKELFDKMVEMSDGIKKEIDKRI